MGRSMGMSFSGAGAFELMQALSSSPAWLSQRQESKPRQEEMEEVFACTRTEAAFRALLRAVKSPAEAFRYVVHLVYFTASHHQITAFPPFVCTETLEYTRT